VKRYSMHCFVVLAGLFLDCQIAQATNDFEYPELLVSPKASERLTMEAKSEPSKAWTTHIPVQLSALSTLAAGAMAYNSSSRKEDDTEGPKYAGMAAMGIGAGWLLITGTMSAMYAPYRTGLAAIKEVGGSTKREQLTKERIAEEYLEKPASLGWKLNLLSNITNLAACGYAISATESMTANVVAGIAALLSFGPWMFSYHWQDVADRHSDYKKKIYGPISGPTILFKEEAKRAKPVPGIASAVYF
jgi:hypothetical protein